MINLDLPETLPKSDRDEIKREVGEYVKTAILDYVGDGKSPVSGRAFKKLSGEYAEREKGGRTLPNLELEGDMLNSLDFRVVEKGVEVGIFDSSQAPKAYNHNVGDTLPKRQFIPAARQSFVGEIEAGIKEIVNEKLREAVASRLEPAERPRQTPSDTRATAEILADRESRVNFAIANLVRGILGG